MKPGDLAEIIVPIPTLFEQEGGDLTHVIKSGDLVLLVKYEPMTWPRPHWKVVHEGRTGFIAARWIRPMKDPGSEYIIE
jgi:hypothetical protein